MPAWQPVLTAGTVLPTFFIIGIAFIPVGIALLYFSDEVREHIIDYTNCLPSDPAQRIGADNTNRTCAQIIADDEMAQCQCNIDFTLERDFLGKVFMYYGLTNYYQNHRRYVKSRDDEQLLGRLTNEPSSDCRPFDVADDKRPIAPCGAIANSLFNDTLTIRKRPTNAQVPLLNTGIAWPSDKQIKFSNPKGDLQEALKNYARPLAWRRELWELDPGNPSNNGFQNEDLIVWMRTAALPSFRKLYRRVDHTKKFYEEGLAKGDYTLQVDYSKFATFFTVDCMILI